MMPKASYRSFSLASPRAFLMLCRCQHWEQKSMSWYEFYCFAIWLCGFVLYFVKLINMCSCCACACCRLRLFSRWSKVLRHPCSIGTVMCLGTVRKQGYMWCTCRWRASGPCWVHFCMRRHAWRKWSSLLGRLGCALTGSRLWMRLLAQLILGLRWVCIAGCQ